MPGDSELGAFRRYEELEATAAHIVNIQSKMDRLARVKLDAWAQLLAGVNREFLGEEELAELIEDMKASFGEGFSKFWNAHMPATLSCVKVRTAVTQRRLRRAEYERNRPNGPTAGTWVGTFPISWEQPIALWGQAVVYVLFDGRNDPAYVGSTDNLPLRLRKHEREKPGLARWMAYRCVDREDAYRLEDKLLKEHKPHLNKRRGR